MSRAIKLTKNDYLDSTSVVYNRTTIDGLLSKITGTTLYDNSNGTTGNITLSDSLANYSYIDVYYIVAGYNDKCFSRVISPNGSTMNLTNGVKSERNTYFKTSRYTLSGTSISVNTAESCEINITQNTTQDGNNIYITKVVGFK